MNMSYPSPAGTMSASDLYGGTASYASPPAVNETVNKGTASIEEKAVKSTGKEPVPAASSSGFEVPVLVALFVAALVLVRYY